MSLKSWTVCGLFAATLIGAGCTKTNAPAPTKSSAKEDDHENHGAGPHGGAVIELGKFHGEIVVDREKKTATVYILDGKVKNAAPIGADQLLLSVKKPQFQIELKADPQASDPKGKCSRFTATHDNLAGKDMLEGTVSMELDGKPYLGDFLEFAHKDGKPVMKDEHGRTIESKPVDAQSALFLKPGGAYTEADIKANGGLTVDQKYKNFKANHDLKPAVGAKICPITLTKADPKLTWIVGGKTYEFCCPPCVEEFVELAKTKPEEIKDPSAYIKK